MIATAYPLRTAKALWLFAILALTACGGASPDNPPSTDSDRLVEAGPSLYIEDEYQRVMQGRFLDSKVSGLWYEAYSVAGHTDANGQFDYVQGESVHFYLGSIYLGYTNGEFIVTPDDLTDSSLAVEQMLQLLQSFDEDGDPANGIVIPEAVDQALVHAQLNLPLGDAEFLQQAALRQVLYRHTNLSEWVDAANAWEHYQQTTAELP